MKRFFHKRYFIITLMMFITIFVFTSIPINCLFLDPVKTAISDFDVYDVVFSKIREEQKADTNIVLVNIGNLSRYDIARQINIINFYEPKVVAVDIFFEREKDSHIDAFLADAFSRCSNPVFVSRLDKYNKNRDGFDTVLTSIDLFNKYASNGFSNLPTDENSSFKTIREVRTKASVRGTPVPLFAGKVLEKYDSTAFEFYKKRKESVEQINYVGNFNKFYCLDHYQVLDGEKDLNFLRNKIVLLGFMGIDLNTKTFEDIYFTPLNEKYAGKSFPDMYGVVIQANIISMLINKNYINVMPEWISILIAVFLTYISAYVIYNVRKKISDWFWAITKLYISILSLLNLFIGVMLFHHLNYRVNLTLALAVVVLSGTIVGMYQIYVAKIFKSLEDE